MQTLLPEPLPAEVEAFLERRRRLGLADGKYEPIERSGLIDLGTDELTRQIDWP